jgi:hypothetical protein
LEPDTDKPDHDRKRSRIVRIILWSVAAAGVSGILFEVVSIVAFLWSLRHVAGLLGQ